MKFILKLRTNFGKNIMQTLFKWKKIEKQTNSSFYSFDNSITVTVSHSSRGFMFKRNWIILNFILDWTLNCTFSSTAVMFL